MEEEKELEEAKMAAEKATEELEDEVDGDDEARASRKR